MTTRLPDVPRIQDPAVYEFLQRVKVRLGELQNLVDHIHNETAGIGTLLASQISDFDEAVQDVVSGELIAGTNIQLLYDDTLGQLQISGVHGHPVTDIVGFTEAIQDIVGAMLVAGTDISLNYDDSLGTVTITNIGGGGGGGSGPPFLSTDITDFNEAARDAIGACLVAGTGISITVNDAGDTITITNTGGGGGGGVPYGYIGAWEHGVTTGNSAATNTTALNALIASAHAAGGGTIWFSSPGDYLINGTITLKSFVSIRMAKGARFAWAGATTGSIFQTLTTDVVVNADYQIIINEGFGFTGIVFDLHSHLYCNFDILGLGASGACTFVKIGADSTSGQSYPLYSLNTGLNNYKIQHMGIVGIGLHIVGKDLGGSGQVVTLCTFYNTQFTQCQVRGIRIDRWADTNTFTGDTYVNAAGANSYGVTVNEIGSPEPSVYNLRFDHLAIDTFGTGLSRTGLYLGLSKLIYIDSFFQNPTAENGQMNVAACTSYVIRGQDPSVGDDIYIHQKGIHVGL